MVPNKSPQQEPDASPFDMTAERLAARLGLTAREYLDQQVYRLRNSEFPTPECITPDEVMEYTLGEFPQCRGEHVKGCSFCAAMLRSVPPDPGLLEEFRQRAREVAEAVPRVQEGARAWYSAWLRPAVVSVAVLAGCLLILIPNGRVVHSPPVPPLPGPQHESQRSATDEPDGLPTAHGAAVQGPSSAGRDSGNQTALVPKATIGSRADKPEGRAGRAGAPVSDVIVSDGRGDKISKRAGGRPRDAHTSDGMSIFHYLDGHQRVEVERADHSRIVAERGGRGGYVERPFSFRGHEFAIRTYYRDGNTSERYYGQYTYRGQRLSYYTPASYFRPEFYGWAYNPWVAPVPYAWDWGRSPWYGYYGYYFRPYPVYASASLWLTDYMISQSLAAAYRGSSEAAAQAAPPPQAAPLTPEVKEMIAEEVKRQIALENHEAQAAQVAVPDPTSSSVQRMLTDNVRHVFLVGHELDVVNSKGNECAVGQGDTLQLVGPPPPDSQVASLLVLSSKGGVECRRNDTISVQIGDLQEMQNHMRAMIDAGLAELRAGRDSGGLPTMAALSQGEPVKAGFTAEAPPPDPNVSTELAQQYNAGLVAEQQVLARSSETKASELFRAQAPPPAEPAEIAMGQSIDDVVAALGQPIRIVDLATKKIYVYKDMKITFKDGKVSDVQYERRTLWHLRPSATSPSRTSG